MALKCLLQLKRTSQDKCGPHSASEDKCYSFYRQRRCLCCRAWTSFHTTSFVPEYYWQSAILCLSVYSLTHGSQKWSSPSTQRLLRSSACTILGSTFIKEPQSRSKIACLQWISLASSSESLGSWAMMSDRELRSLQKVVTACGRVLQTTSTSSFTLAVVS